MTHGALHAPYPLGQLDLRRVNFNYLVQRQKGDPPRWAPLRAFDDGAKTYIQFPPGRVTAEAPPLFVLGRTTVDLGTSSSR